MDRAQLTKALTRLMSLKEHLPTDRQVEETYVQMFNDIMVDLSKISGYDLAGLYISESISKNIPLMGKYGPDARVTQWSEKWYCDRSYLLIQIDATLLLFEYELRHPEKRPIGFRPPAKPGQQEDEK